MIASRPYLVTDQLLDYGDDQFLQLDIEAVYAMRGFELIMPQIALVNAVNDPRHRFITGCLSRRTGKTDAANTIGFCKAIEPNKHILVISPNFRLSTISWDLQHHLFDVTGLRSEIKSSNSQNKVIKLKNGTTISLASANNIDSAVGRSYDLIIGDEFALDESLGDGFMIQLRPTLDKLGSKAIFISTPRGDNHFKEFYDKGFMETSSQWVSIHSTYKDNPRANAEDIEDAKAVLSTAMFAQEYLAEFVTFEGQIYEDLDETNEVTDEEFEELVADADLEYIMGIDPGYKDPTAAVSIMFDMEKQLYIITDEYEESEGTTSIHAEAFKIMSNELCGDDEPDIAYCDSASAQFRNDLAMDYDFSTSKSDKSVLDGIAYISELIARKKILFKSSCEKTIKAHRNYSWNVNNTTSERPTHDQWSHLCDAVRYAIYTHRGI